MTVNELQEQYIQEAEKKFHSSYEIERDGK